MKDHAQYAEDLARYAMGTLDDRDRAEVESHLGTCGECRRELEALRSDLALVAMSVTGPQPPQRARQRLMDSIGTEKEEARRPQSSPVIGRLRPRWLGLAPVGVAILLAITSLGLLLEVQRLKEANTRVVAELKREKVDSAHAKEVLAMLDDPQAQNVTLRRVNDARQPQIKTVYQKGKGHILLLATNLEPIPDDKVYQLWLLPASGAAPMPRGTFRIDNSGNGMMLDTMDETGVEAKGFAITVEPVGGSKTPTMPIKYAS
jgi:anti-sigma-K factor RskA